MAAVAAVAGLFLTVPALREQARTSLTHEPTAFAALAFADPDPQRVCTGLRAGEVRFTAQNAGPAARSFRYQVTLAGGGSDRLVLPGTVDVDRGAGTAVAVLVPPAARGAGEVDVRLLDADLSVRVSCTGTAG